MSIIDKLNLDLAWKRCKHGYETFNFVKRPFEIELIERDWGNWIDRFSQSVSSGYQPHDVKKINVPKSGNLIRTGLHLTPQDRLLYNALVGACQREITQRLSWAQGEIDCSYQLTDDFSLETWVSKDFFDYWKEFRKKSLAKIDSYDWMLVTDIASFYDNIDLRTLRSHLNECGIENEVSDLLLHCLRRWRVFEGKGIPQGMCASHVLGKLYLDRLDQEISNSGYEHLRYNDDIRVFCNSKAEARKAITLITNYLRDQLGLTIQSAKTKILEDSGARNEINGVQQTIDAIEEKLKEDGRVIAIPGDGYHEDVFLRLPREVRNEDAIKEAADELIGGDRPFDSTLFHYLINRLGRMSDDRAVDYCLSMISARPEETKHILRYVDRLDAFERIEPRLTEHMKSDRSVYDHQLYQIISWMTELNLNRSPAAETLTVVRKLAFNRSYEFHLRSAAKFFLGRYGNKADLDGIKQDYNNCDYTEQLETIMSLTRMEKQKRNTFYGRVGDDSPLHATATRLAKDIS